VCTDFGIVTVIKAMYLPNALVQIANKMGLQKQYCHRPSGSIVEDTMNREVVLDSKPCNTKTIVFVGVVSPRRT
jgi:hypothetical protein